MSLHYKGSLVGHRGMVTSLATAASDGKKLVSGSRDKTSVVWHIEDLDHNVPGYAVKSLTGHNQAVEDVVVSSDGSYAISASWDKTLRLWNLESGDCRAVLKGHTSDVLSVAFSPDNRQIVSSSRDKTIRLWNTYGECKFIINQQGQHTDWISCVRFSPSTKVHKVVSAGWDKKVKLWDLADGKLTHTLDGHRGPLYAVTISPDGTLCASGGKEGVTMLWAISDAHALYSLDAGAPINALAFSPKKYWLCAATDNSIRVWDLEHRKTQFLITRKDFEAECAVEGVATLKRESNLPWVTSIAWSVDGTTLFAGTATGEIHVFDVQEQQ